MRISRVSIGTGTTLARGVDKERPAGQPFKAERRSCFLEEPTTLSCSRWPLHSVLACLLQADVLGDCLKALHLNSFPTDLTGAVLPKFHLRQYPVYGLNVFLLFFVQYCQNIGDSLLLCRFFRFDIVL
jgi:hypothetical protein